MTTVHLAIDVEALGGPPAGRIVEIGIVAFTVDVVVDELWLPVWWQSGSGEIDGPTLAWWFSQPDLQLRALDEHRLSLPDALSALCEWSEPHVSETSTVWAYGSTYDFPVLHAAFAATRERRVAWREGPPWHFRQQRCARTARELLDRPTVERDHQRHHALEDARWTASIAQRALALRSRP